jgi:hypothetical protein
MSQRAATSDQRTLGCSRPTYRSPDRTVECTITLRIECLRMTGRQFLVVFLCLRMPAGQHFWDTVMFANQPALTMVKPVQTTSGSAKAVRRNN